MTAMDIARIQHEEMLRFRGIDDESDAIADVVMQLSIYYQDPDIDKFLDMPASRLSEMVKAIERHNKAMQDSMRR